MTQSGHRGAAKAGKVSNGNAQWPLSADPVVQIFVGGFDELVELVTLMGSIIWAASSLTFRNPSS